MNQRVGFLILAILILAILITSLLVFSETQNFPFSSDLRVDEVAKYDGTSDFTVFDGETMLGNIHFSIEPEIPSGSGQNQMTISFSLFYNQTELDSIIIRFSAGTNIVSIFRKATSYDWEYKFHTESSNVVFEVPDLGWYGQSTSKLDFILFPNDATSLFLDMQLSMHKMAPLQLTSLKAQVHIDATIPKTSSS